MCEVWAGRLVPAACGGDLKFYTVMRTGLHISNFAVCDGIFTLLYFVQMGAWVV